MRFLHQPRKLRKPRRTGAPGRIRTYDLKLRRLVLYPTELRARASTALAALGALKNH